MESEVVFLNVSAGRPSQAVLPPLVQPPVPSLLPDGLYQPPDPPSLEYDDYDNTIDDGNSTQAPNYLLLSLLSLFFVSFVFVLVDPFLLTRYSSSLDCLY